MDRGGREEIEFKEDRGKKKKKKLKRKKKKERKGWCGPGCVRKK